MAEFPAFGSVDLDTLINPWQARHEHLRNAFPPSALPDEPEGFQKAGPEEEGVSQAWEDCSRPPQTHHQLLVPGKKADLVIHDKEIPGVYEVNGIYPHEAPVIGSYVDQRILPGFHYRVRMLDTERYMFKGKPLALQSIGIGYGKRITFAGERLNVNDNYFYSDTQARGMGFALVALRPGDTFAVNDLDGHPVGEGVVEDVVAERDLSTRVEEDGAVVKRAVVSFSCRIRHSAGHGLMPLQSEERHQLAGVALIVRQRSARKAQTKYIEKLELPRTGPCVFEIIQQRL